MHNWGPIFSRPVRICVPTGDFVDDQLSDVDEDDMGAEVNRLQSDEEEDEDADAEEEEEALQYGRVNEPLIRDHPGWQKSPTSIKNKIQPGKSVIDFFFYGDFICNDRHMGRVHECEHGLALRTRCTPRLRKTMPTS